MGTTKIQLILDWFQTSIDVGRYIRRIVAKSPRLEIELDGSFQAIRKNGTLGKHRVSQDKIAEFTSISMYHQAWRILSRSIELHGITDIGFFCTM